MPKIKQMVIMKIATRVCAHSSRAGLCLKQTDILYLEQTAVQHERDEDNSNFDKKTTKICKPVQRNILKLMMHLTDFEEIFLQLPCGKYLVGKIPRLYKRGMVLKELCRPLVIGCRKGMSLCI